jgi:predicted TIM-barrel fold metal-dependent hydrolase
MIVDSHAHIFPFLGSAAGFDSVEEHMRYLQLYMVGHGQPTRRFDDHAIMPEQGLAEAPLDGPHRLYDVDFRVEDNGRFAWRQGEHEVYMHFMPPSLQPNASPPDFLLAQMAYAGVDIAVLQNAHLYGRLNEYFAAAIARHPGKLIGLAEVNEPLADSEQEQDKLRGAVHELGLSGLYFANRGFFFVSYERTFEDPAFDGFWGLVRALNIPVFWEIEGVPGLTPENYVREIDRLNCWASRNPEIPCVLTHGIHPGYFRGSLPEPIEKLFANNQFLIEILYPISWGRLHEYPYPELRPVIKELYTRVGGQRLIWGSDIPNVERHCTYRQSLDYLRRFSDLMPSSDMDRILGGNLLELFQFYGNTNSSLIGARES